MLEDVVHKLMYNCLLPRRMEKKQHNVTIFSNIPKKIEDMSDKNQIYIETFLLELEKYDFTINWKKVVISVVKH